MIDQTLCNLVFNKDGFFADHPRMVLEASGGSATYDQELDALSLAGDVDFTTYLNALSVGKWRKYANLGGVYLRLEVRGDAFDVHMTLLARDSAEVTRDNTPLAHVDAHEAWHTVELVVPVPDGAHIVSFALTCKGRTELRGGAWFTKVNDDALRDVYLAVATTTFRKEEYVLRNIEVIRDELFGGGCDSSKTSPNGIVGTAASEEYHLFVVDNGRTLDAEALSDDNVTVIHNPNVGGSGGFARGMMAALDTGATHVLLMDDDVRVFPESFKRTRNLLRLAKDSYQDAFVQGAMLNMEDPHLLFEDVAQVKRDGMYRSLKKNIVVEEPVGVALAEAVDVELERVYGAWWYCCIPTKVVREHGLPLPLFVRCDDVEYGMRTKPTLMTMNGICVWHERFEGRFRASVDSYQLTRNFLIMSACDKLDSSIVRAFMMRFSRTFNIYLRSMNYDTCDLLLDGLADYLKGPSFIANVDGEEILRKNSQKNERLVNVNEIDDPAVEQAPPNKAYLAQDRDRGMLLKALEMIPHDRHMLPDALLSNKPAPMYYSRGAYPARDTMRKKTLVAYDQTGTMANVRTMDRARWGRLRERMRVLMREYRKHGEDVAEVYRAAMPTLTSWEFWEDYLATRS